MRRQKCGVCNSAPTLLVCATTDMCTEHAVAFVQGTTLFGIELPGAAGAVLSGVADVASGMFDVTKDVTKGLVLVSFKAAGLIRSAWMETVHKWAHT